MNYLNRAIKNVTRRLSKSILILLTFFVIGNFVIVGLGISEASENAKTLTRKSMKAVIEFKFDHQTFWNDVDEIEDEEERDTYIKDLKMDLTKDDIVKMGNDERIKAINAINTDIVYSLDFNSVPIGNEDDSKGEFESGFVVFDAEVTTSQDIYPNEEYEYKEPDILLKKIWYSNLIEFSDQEYTMVDGEMITDDHIKNGDLVCVITDTLALENDLKIGDKISLNSNDQSAIDREWITEEEFENATDEVEIIGIFDNINEVDPSAENFKWMQAFESPENIVITPASINLSKQLEENIKNYEQGKLDYPNDDYYNDPDNYPTLEELQRVNEPVFLLEDPLDVEQFVEDYTSEEYLPNKYFILDANNKQFETYSKPLDTMSSFANIIVYIVLFNAVVIITLVTALTLKTREYEIGVLLAMGVSKFKVVLQFFIELAIIAVIGFSLSVISGSMIAKTVGDSILENQLAQDPIEEVEDNNHGWVGDEDYFTEISIDDMLSKYEVNISTGIIVQIYVAGLAVVLISILIPALMIMRFNPKRILTNTN